MERKAFAAALDKCDVITRKRAGDLLAVSRRLFASAQAHHLAERLGTIPQGYGDALQRKAATLRQQAFATVGRA